MDLSPGLATRQFNGLLLLLLLLPASLLLLVHVGRHRNRPTERVHERHGGRRWRRFVGLLLVGTWSHWSRQTGSEVAARERLLRRQVARNRRASRRCEVLQPIGIVWIVDEIVVHVVEVVVHHVIGVIEVIVPVVYGIWSRIYARSSWWLC